MLIAVLGSILAYAAGGGTVTAKGSPFLAEVAATDNEKARGLMYRQNLAKDRCMMFLYDEDGHHSIWMKNCLIALDVVWVKADGVVVETAENVPPVSQMYRGSDQDLPTYGGSVPSRYFIEFAAGTLRRINLKKGDRIGWDLKLDDGRLIKGGALAVAKRKAKK
jgi:uncharacterized membrane protein (UPF0127 family)